MFRGSRTPSMEYRVNCSGADSCPQPPMQEMTAVRQVSIKQRLAIGALTTLVCFPSITIAPGLGLARGHAVVVPAGTTESSPAIYRWETNRVCYLESRRD